MTTVNNVEAKQMSNKENEGIPDELKHWSCNACYRTFDVNEVKPWTCNKRSDTCNEIMCMDCAQPKFHRDHPHSLYHISKGSIREIPEVESYVQAM